MVASPLWLIVGMGYTPGSWKDGRTCYTYDGSQEFELEWDEFDFSNQSVRYTPYTVASAAVKDTQGIGTDDKKSIQCAEYPARVTTTAPDGGVARGCFQVAHFVNGLNTP